MKFLDNLPELDLLSSALSYASPSLKVTTRIEAYSCKPVSREKKLYKALEQDLVSDLEFSVAGSPPEDHDAQVGSAFGPLDKRESRKTLYHLISTLNQAFPDFDFSGVRADEFTREPSARSVLSSLSTALNHLRASAATTSNTNSVYRSFSSFSSSPANNITPQADNGFPYENNAQGSYDTPTHPFLRQILDPIVDLSECEVYSYAPDIDSDPHAAESERGSVAPSEVGDDTSSSRRTESEDGHWPMDGFESVPASPTTMRKLRSGKSYPSASNSPGQSFTRRNVEGPRMALRERSRSNTPSIFEQDAASSGLLWSCNYFFYNKTKKRILFISHTMKRVVPHQMSDRSLPLSAYAHARLSDGNLYNSPFTRTRSRSSGVPLYGMEEDGKTVKRIK